MTFCLILALAVAAAAYLIPTQSDDSSAAGTGNYEISGMPGTYDDLASAFDAVNKDSGTSFIIIVHGDDADVTSFVLDSGKKVTLMSSDGNQFVLKISDKRHGTVNGDLTLENIILDGNETAGGIEVSASASLTMKDGAVIQNCYTDLFGGGVHSKGTFIMEGGKISGNTASDGGGVHNTDKGIFTMKGGEISDNTAEFYCGGGVYSEGTFIMEGGKISGNTASDGGGVYIYRSTFTMTGGEISYNTARDDGGGVYGYTFTMTGGEISYNKAFSGAGVYNNGYMFTMIGGEISNNLSKSRGGGVYNYNYSSFTMTGGKISNNTADYGAGVYSAESCTFSLSGGEISNNTAFSGAGVYNNYGSFTMTGGEISNNTASYGGGMYNAFRSAFTMEGGKISNNTADYGAGVYNDHGYTFTMTGGEISYNTADYGGGVYNKRGILTMEGGKISNNRAYDHGGGVYNYDSSSFTMTGGEISNNHAYDHGGGVYNYYYSSFTMTGGEISYNTARQNGGGIYTDNFANLIIAEGVVFSGNTAKTLRAEDISAAEDIDMNGTSDLDDYANNIGSVILDARVNAGQNAPAYNNHDINYPGDSYVVYVNIDVDGGGTVTATDSDDGTVYGVLTSDGWIYVPIAAVSITLSAVSEKGYEFRQFIIDGTSENGNDPVVIPISGNMSVAAEFESTAMPPAEDEEYTIEAAADGGSTVTPAGEVSVSAGSDMTFAFSAKPGYLITAVYVDGVAISSEKLASGKYTFSDVVADHTIKVFTTIIGGGGSGGGGSNGGGNGGTDGNGGGSGGGDIGGNGGNEGGPSGSGVSESGGSAIGLICAMIAVLAGIAAVAVGVKRFRKR